MARFFVSYTGVDTQWAEWVAWTLEHEGHEIILQKWDFRPGGNFVVEMQRAAATAERTIAILSPDYLNSSFATPEWIAALADDPTGSKLKLVPVRVRECELGGLWKAIIHIDLVGADEAEAKRRLIEGLNMGRAKPAMAPKFPGDISPSRQTAPFPGRRSASAPYIPKMRRGSTDLDQRQFIRTGIGQIRNYFEHALAELRAANSQIDDELTQTSPTDFNAEIFLNGKSKCRCRIWLGGLFGQDEISYAEGQSIRGNAVNESLSVAIEGDALVLRALMAPFGRFADDMDLERLSIEQASDYLWRRFVTFLER
jgi:hypothetical protein